MGMQDSTNWSTSSYVRQERGLPIIYRELIIIILMDNVWKDLAKVDIFVCLISVCRSLRLLACCNSALVCSRLQLNSFIESIGSLWWRQKLLMNHYLATLLTTINSLECGNYYRSVRGTLASRSVVNGPLKDGVNKSRTIDELQGVSPWRGFFTPLSLLLLILFGGLRLTIASQGRGGWCWFQARCVWHIFMVQT